MTFALFYDINNEIKRVLFKNYNPPFSPLKAARSSVMKNLLFSNREDPGQSPKDPGQSPYEVLWTGVVLLACSLFNKIEEEGEFEKENGQIIPRRYWRGLSINGSVINLSAFTDEAIHGTNPRGDNIAASNDHIVVRCTIERQVFKQKIFHHAIVALEQFLESLKPRNLKQPHLLWVGLRSFRVVLEAYPKILGEDKHLQSHFSEFINPLFGQADERFMSLEQIMAAQSDPAFVPRLLQKLKEIEFEQEYNPVRFDSCSKEDFLEALRTRSLYEIRFDGNRAGFEERKEKSAFWVRHRKAFDLRYFNEAGDTVKLEQIPDDEEINVTVAPSPILIAVQALPVRELDELTGVYAKQLEEQSVMVPFPFVAPSDSPQ